MLRKSGTRPKKYLNFMSIVSNYEVASRDYPGNHIIPKFEYLNAVSKNKIEQDQNKLKNRLNELISKYPEDSVSALAKDLLAYLNTAPKDIDSLRDEPVTSVYEKEDRGLHYAIFVVSTDKTDINQYKNNVVDFNRKYFMNKKIEVKSIPLLENKTMITVQIFKGLDDVMQYYEALVDNNSFLDIGAGQKFYIMTKANYSKFYKDQDVEKYETFMNTAYFN